MDCPLHLLTTQYRNNHLQQKKFHVLIDSSCLATVDMAFPCNLLEVSFVGSLSKGN